MSDNVVKFPGHQAKRGRAVVIVSEAKVQTTTTVELPVDRAPTVEGSRQFAKLYSDSSSNFPS